MQVKLLTFRCNNLIPKFSRFVVSLLRNGVLRCEQSFNEQNSLIRGYLLVTVLFHPQDQLKKKSYNTIFISNMTWNLKKTYPQKRVLERCYS